MIICSIQSLEKYYGDTLIFKNISFDIKDGERIGLIGKNGTGKTTLMKNLMGKEEFSGEICFRKGIKVAYLEQIPDYEENCNVMDVLYLAFQDILEIRKQMLEAEVRLGECGEEQLEKEIKKYSLLQEQFQNGGGYEIEEKVGRILTGLQIPEAMQKRSFNNLSGGEKSRIILGKILLEEPDLLLLDEPSNHLDLKTIEWLEAYLRKYKGALLVISHDRYFLDEVVTRVIELTPTGLQSYEGNYSYYVEEKENRFLKALKDYNAREKEIKRMEEQIKRYRIWGESRSSEKMFAKAKQLERRLDKIDELDKPIHKEKAIRLNGEGGGRTGKEVLVIDKLRKSFGEKMLFENLSFTLFYQDSLGILGANGCGKSTLFKMILNEHTADKGSIKLGARVKIGYLPQEVVFEDEQKSVLETFQYAFNLKVGEARKELAKVLFVKDDVFKKVKSLSGGEKSRLKICMILFEKVNFLILDEPTNHLDIDSREILENTLMDFEGSILFISHDRYFINKIATKIGEIESKGFKIYEGDYKYYGEQRLKSANNIVAQEVSKQGKTVSKKPKYTDADKVREKLEKKLLMYEQQIEKIENTIKVIEGKMLEVGSDIEKLYELESQKERHKEKLEEVFAEWESVSLKLI